MTVVERTGEVNLTATSSSGNVRVLAGAQQVPQVQLRYGALSGYDEQRLGAEISTTVASAMRRFQRLRLQQQSEGRSRFPESADLASERQDRVDHALSDMDIRELAPHGYVKVAWRGHCDIEVRLKPGSLKAVFGDLRAVETEVNAGLRQATEQHARQALRIRCDVHSSYLNRQGRI